MQETLNSVTNPLFEFAGWAEAFDSLDIGISVISPAHRLEYINQSYRRLVGIPDEIQPGASAFDMYVHIARRGDLGEGDPEALANKRLQELSNGCWSAIVHNSNPGNVCKVDRAIIEGGYIVSSITDITQNVEYEAMLSSVLDAADRGIMIIDKTGVVEYVNDTYRAMFEDTTEIEHDSPTFSDCFLKSWKRGKFHCDFMGAKSDALGEEDFLSGVTKLYEKSLNEAQLIKVGPACFIKLSGQKTSDGRTVLSFSDNTDTILREQEVKDAQEKSRNELNDFQIVFDNTDVGLVLVDRDLKVLLINNAFQGLWKIDPDRSHIGESLRVLFDYNRSKGIYDVEDENWEDYVKERMDEISAGSIDPREFSRADGKVLIYSCSALSDGRRLLKYSDISEFKKRELELQQAQETAETRLEDFSAVINNMDIGLALVDKNLDFLMINDPFYEIWKIKPEELPVGSSTLNFMELNRKNNVYKIRDEDWSDEAWAEYTKARLDNVRDGDMDPREFVCADGRTFVFAGTALSNGQKLLRYTNITEFKKREAALKAARLESENTLADFSAALNNMDLGLVLLDRNLNTVIVNQAFHDIWNTETDAFPPGTPFRALMDYNRYNGIMDVKDDEWEDHIQSRLAELRAGDVLPRELVRADGRVQIYAATTLSGGHKLVSYKEVTEFKKREAELKLARVQAESADRSKSEFLANMSHEIRTPMNGVMGMAELLSKTELSTKQQMFTDVILSSSTALLTIINDILDFSKIEAGKLELDNAPFRLSAAIEDVATLVSTTVAEKNLELIVRIQPDLGDSVIGDAGRFRQIITNLLGNAVKFTDKGHVLVDVSGKVDNGIVHLKCSVQDTGIGIPEDLVETVFEKFSQVDGSSTRRHEGTGLGLAIASRLVTLMDGEIGCSSELGKGSNFWFTAQMPADKDASPSLPVPIDATGARILAIDDNSVNRSILLEQFDAWKLNGKAAASGLEGLAMLRRSIHEGQPFDAIVLDFHMPDMNGLDVARVIRNDEMLKDAPIVMLTSVDNISDNQQFKMLNIDAHLTKPARASQLLESIVDILQSTNVAEQAAALQQSSIEVHSEFDRSIPPIAPFAAPGAAGDCFASSVEPVPNRDVSDTSTKGASVRSDVQEIVALAESASGSGISVLVAEDNDVNQLVFTQILEYMDYEFKIVGNGALAVDAVKALRPRVILMDVSMPVMNGLDATREIRRWCDEENPDDGYRPAIIGVTAHALKNDRDMCFAAGMDDYLSKPISPDKLTEKVNDWMQGVGEDTKVLAG